VVSDQDHERLARAAEPAPSGPLADALAAALPKGWTPERARTALASRGEDPARLAALRRSVGRRLRPGGRLAWQAWRTRDAVASRLRKPLTALYRRGPSVALLGPDGAGKSHLVHELPDAFPLGVRTYYLGLYPAGSEHHRGPKGLGFMLRLGGLWRRYAAARVQQLRGRMVLFDRHPYDARLAPRQRPRRVDRLRRAMLGHALPAPDLTLILDAPGAVLHARKPEHPADLLEAEMVRYRVLSERLPRAELVDATRSPEDVLDDVVARIWRVWARRLDGGR
jgi:thymidylate kinase